MELAPRLAAVGALVPEGARFADICCDHAQLAISLKSARRVSRAIAVDIAEAPLALASKNARAAGVDLDLRRGDGLAALQPGDATCIALAGIGGSVAVRILSPPTLDDLGVERIVVQVNKKLPEVRRHLYAAGWRTAAETVVRAGSRLFVTSAFERGAFRPDPIDLLVGPLIRSRPGELEDELIAHQRSWIEELERVTEKLPSISVGVTSEMLGQLELSRSRERES